MPLFQATIWTKLWRTTVPGQRTTAQTSASTRFAESAHLFLLSFVSPPRFDYFSDLFLSLRPSTPKNIVAKEGLNENYRTSLQIILATGYRSSWSGFCQTLWVLSRFATVAVRGRSQSLNRTCEFSSKCRTSPSQTLNVGQIRNICETVTNTSFLPIFCVSST